MHLSRLTLRNFRLFGDGDEQLDIPLGNGVTALVGRNDCGKSAVIDAIRYALLTRDQSYIRVQPEDFHINAAGIQANEIRIRCQLSDLSDDEGGLRRVPLLRWRRHHSHRQLGRDAKEPVAGGSPLG